MKKVSLSSLASVSLVLFGLVASAQSPSSSSRTANPNAVAAYYDSFDGPWIDPMKWMAIGPWCAQGTTIECVREIQHGRLRLEIRNMGLTAIDDGFQFADASQPFVNPNSIFSITADVQLGRITVVGCPTNASGQPTRVVSNFGGAFFNTGSLDQADDVSDTITFWVDASSPNTLQVINWLSGSGLGVATPIANYPIGTALTVTNAWDRTNRAL
jgi:hypothetical protein